MTTGQADLAGRERLLDAAEAEVAAASLGPGQVSLRAIARRAGLSHNAAQHHFGDRAGLFTALALRGFSKLRRHLVDAADAAADADGDGLSAIGQAYVDFGLTAPNLLDLMFRAELVHADDPDLRAAQASTFGALEGSIAAGAVDAAHGKADGNEVVTDQALRAWAFVHGLVMLARVGALVPPGVRPDPAVSAAVARRLVGSRPDS